MINAAVYFSLKRHFSGNKRKNIESVGIASLLFFFMCLLKNSTEVKMERAVR